VVLKVKSRGESVKALQKGLASLGYHPGPIDGIFGPSVEEAVCHFQMRNGLLVDGVAGPSTLKKYNAALDKALSDGKLESIEGFKVIEDPIPEVNLEPGEFYKWVKCPANIVDGYAGYSRLTLREDTAAAYRKLYDEVHSLGGVVTTAGGKRSLSSKSSPSRSKKSFHYTGRAFDLALPTGMQNPDKDPYLIQRDPDSSRKWIVWCRTENPEVPEVEIEACWVTSHKNSKGKRYTRLNSKPVTVRAFNFTSLAKKHGFERISGRRSFFSGGTYTGSEWWHFQWEVGLVAGETTFGEELLKAYSLEEAQKFIYWSESKNCRFRKEWF
jgi:hypothetical protein